MKHEKQRKGKIDVSELINPTGLGTNTIKVL
jgi:hypothetical protein